MQHIGGATRPYRSKTFRTFVFDVVSSPLLDVSVPILLRLENRTLDAGMYEGSESVVVRFRGPNNLIDFPPVGESHTGSGKIGEEFFHNVASDLFWVGKGSRCPGERSESGNAYQRQTNLEPPCGEAAKIGYRPRKAIEEAHWANDSDYI